MRDHILTVLVVVSFTFIGVLLLPAEASAACENWTQRNPVAVPPGRGYPASVYDSARGVTVIFGGWSGSAVLNDTWEWDGTNWTQRTPTTVPPARSGQAMAYDSGRGVTVFFGGAPNKGGLNDTWEWDGTNWTQRTPTTAPSARRDSAMAYDSVRGVTVLFGGAAGNFSSYLGDTWEWNGSNWTQRTPATSPSIRGGHAMAYDSARGVTVLFGGSTGSNPMGDTWEWDGTNWMQRMPAISPSARVSHPLAYDSARGVTVLFGGNDGGEAGDTWEWDGTNWIQRFPAGAPSGRSLHGMAYDSGRGVTVLFGGGWGIWLNDTWEYPQLGHGADDFMLAVPMDGWDNGGVFRFGFSETAPLDVMPPIPANLVSDPVSAAFSANGELFVGNRHGNVGGGVGSISRFTFDHYGSFTPNGTITGNSLEAVHGMAFSPQGELFAVNYTARTISRFLFDQNGAAVPHGTLSVGAWFQIAFSPWGELLVPVGNEVLRYRFDDSGQAIPNGSFAFPGSSIIGLGFNPTGELFLADNVAGLVYRYRLDDSHNLIPNGTISVGSPISIAFSPLGELFVSNADVPGGIHRFLFDAQGNAIANGFIQPVSSQPGQVGYIAISRVTPEPATIVAWRSVRQHAGLGELAIHLNPAATGAQVVSETRRNGIQRIEVDFDRDITGLLVGTVGAENANYPGSTFPATAQTLVNNATTLVLEFGSGLPDRACYRIDLAGHITDLIGDTDCLVRGLAGDVNGDGSTDLIDMVWVKSKNMQPVTPDNIRLDVNLDGSIDLIDMALAKSLNGGAATCP